MSSHLIRVVRIRSLSLLLSQVTEVEGMKLDGVFIGACTTAEEDLILGALVLEAGLALGYAPGISGKRKVTPGSLSITAKLKRLGLIAIYERAGFEIGKSRHVGVGVGVGDTSTLTRISFQARPVVVIVWGSPRTRQARAKSG